MRPLVSKTEGTKELLQPFIHSAWAFPTMWCCCFPKQHWCHTGDLSPAYSREDTVCVFGEPIYHVSLGQNKCWRVSLPGTVLSDQLREIFSLLYQRSSFPTKGRGKVMKLGRRGWLWWPYSEKFVTNADTVLIMQRFPPRKISGSAQQQ